MISVVTSKPIAIEQTKRCHVPLDGSDELDNAVRDSKDEQFRLAMERNGFRYRTRQWHEMPSMLDVLESVRADFKRLAEEDNPTPGQFFDAFQPVHWLAEFLKMRRP